VAVAVAVAVEVREIAALAVLAWSGRERVHQRAGRRGGLVGRGIRGRGGAVLLGEVEEAVPAGYNV
jgi:hypothetical protein